MTPNRSDPAPDPFWLGHRLQPYGVRPRTVRIGEDRAKGYELKQFEAAFREHLNGAGNDGNGWGSPAEQPLVGRHFVDRNKPCDG